MARNPMAMSPVMAMAMVSPVPPRPRLRGDARKRIGEAPVGHGPRRIGPVPVSPARRVAVPAVPAIVAGMPAVVAAVVAAVPPVMDEDRFRAGMAPGRARRSCPARPTRPRLKRCSRHGKEQGERPRRDSGSQHRFHVALLSAHVFSGVTAGRRPPGIQPRHSGASALLSTRSSATVRFVSSAAHRSPARSSNGASVTVSGARSSASRAA